MPLGPGTHLGPYEILAPIGAGGMGEVYRARDTRLDREVAVKICAARFSNRFEREARAIASLNHPNICTLYDVGPNYLVMELLEGLTLAERIKQGPVPSEEAIDIARQIADALEAAHEKGIVHRDLKPANIKIKPEGVVKVLDFGLAKIGARETFAEEAASPEDSPTLSYGATQAGVVLGTAAYMAPEQARGKPIDKRTDIWAFGCVLYEMLSGRRTFQGQRTSEIVAAILRDEPDWSALPPNTPPGILGLLGRCLQKNPKQRLHDIADARIEIVEASKQDSRVPATQTLSRWRAGLKWVLILMAAVVAFGVGVLWYGSLGQKEHNWSLLVADIDNQTGQALLDHTVRELLTTTLEQSPVLRVYPVAQLPDALRRMGKPPTSYLGVELALELCQREGLQGIVTGSITRIGKEYLIILKAIDLQGNGITSASARAASLDQVIRSTQDASKTLRKTLGESAATITRTLPLEQVTSSSLQAVQYYSLGKLQLNSGHPADAAILFQRATDSDPAFAMAHCYLGNVYQHLGNLLASRTELSTALKLSGRVTEVERLKIMGDYNLAMNDFAEAARYYELLVGLKPNTATAHLNLGQAYLGEYQFDRGLTETNAAIRIDPEAGFQINAAEILFNAGRSEEAVNRVHQVPSNSADSRALYIEGRCYLAMAKIEEAITVFEQMCKSADEGQARGCAALADIALASHNTDSAKAELQRSLVADQKRQNIYGLTLRALTFGDMSPWPNRGFTDDVVRLRQIENDEQLLLLATQLHGRRKDTESLKETIRALQRLLNSHPTPRIQSFLAIARSTLESIQYHPAAALDLARLAVQYENSSYAVDMLGQAYVVSGKSRDAIIRFEEVLSRSNERMESYDGPAFHRLRQVHDQLINLYTRVGDNSRAEAHAAEIAHLTK
jgi:tetratricopeptide (TPR) repeat protein